MNALCHSQPRNSDTGSSPNGCLKSKAKYLRGALFLVYVRVELKSAAGDRPLHRSLFNKNNNSDKYQLQLSICTVADQFLASGILKVTDIPVEFLVMRPVNFLQRNYTRVVLSWSSDITPVYVYRTPTFFLK